MFRTKNAHHTSIVDGVASILADRAQTQLKEAASAAEVAVEAARDTWVDDVLPRVNAAVADVAANAAAARAAVTEAADNAPAALSVLKGEAVAVPASSKAGKGKGRGKWLFLLGAVAAGAAIAAYRRSASKPDPWVSAAPWTPPQADAADATGESDDTSSQANDDADDTGHASSEAAETNHAGSEAGETSDSGSEAGEPTADGDTGPADHDAAQATEDSPKKSGDKGA